MTKARLEAFSDGVLAVAITLLVLDLHLDPGAGSIPHQLHERWPAFAAYVVSFGVVGVIWVNHHALIAELARVDRLLLFQNLILLLFVTTMPFTTSVLADFIRGNPADARWAALLYGLSNIGMACSFTAMFAHMVRADLLSVPLEPAAGQRAIRQFGLGTLAYPVATIAGVIWPPLMLIALAALAIYYATRTPLGAG